MAGTLISCIRKAGEYLHPEDKAAVLAAAAKYRKGKGSTTDAAKAAVQDRIDAVGKMMQEGPAAQAQDRMAASREDLTKLMQWLGVPEQAQGGAKEGALQQGAEGAVPPAGGPGSIDAWRRMSIDEQRPFHEKFARAFEAYLMEGRAPSVELQGVFRRVRQWMLNVYRSITGLGVELTPEVRGVMDRMLASDEAIKYAEESRSYLPLVKTPEEAAKLGISAEAFEAYQALHQQASDEALDKMMARSARDMKWVSGAKAKALKALQKQADAMRREVRAQVDQELDNSPAFKAKAELDEAYDPSADHKAAWAAWRERRDAIPKDKREAWVKDNPAPEKPRTELDAWNERRDAAREQFTAEERAKAAGDLKGLERGQAIAKAKRQIDNDVERRVLEWEKSNQKPTVQRPQVDLDVIASRNGFESSDDMLRAVREAGDRNDVAQAMTDQRMLEQHGELASPRALEEAAIDAVHNEARARFLATGLKLLSDSKSPAAAIAQAAREAAAAVIGAKQIGALSPAQYLAAETRANREALKLAPKDPAGAMEAQRQAVLNNALAREAQDAQDRVKKGLEYLKALDSGKRAKAIGADYQDRINELLARYDITNRNNSAEVQSQRLEFRDWLQSEFARTGVAPEVPDAILDFAGRKHWKELTVDEFNGLMDAVKSMEHVGREQTKVTVNGKRVDLAEAVEAAKARTADLEHTEPVDVAAHLKHATGLDKMSARWISAKSFGKAADAALLKMEQLFQWLDGGARGSVEQKEAGPWQETAFKPMAEAEGRERAMKADAVAKLSALAEKLRETKVRMSDVLDVPGLKRRGRGEKMYREELLAAALNMGNEGNKQKLLEGYGWKERDLAAAIDRHLSKPEMEFVQGVWDLVGGYGPQIMELQRRLTGVTPEMVKASRLTTKHGTLDGGYYPVVYDAFADRNVETKQAKSADLLFENQWARPATNKGHTIQRTGYVGPIDLSLSVISRHIDQVTHDLAFREAVIDVNKFLSHEGIRDEVEQTFGREYYKQFRPWLQAIANDKTFDTSGASAWEKFIRKARTNTTMVGLGFRLSTMEIHGLSALSNSIGEVGAKWMAKGVAQFATPDRWQATRDFVFERSPEMANRMNEVDRNVTEAINEINSHATEFGARTVAQKAYDSATRFAFYGVSMLDMASAMPTWMGAYMKGMAHERDGGLGMSEDKAIDYANRAVRNAHGGGGVKDLSAIQRAKGPMSLATMFYSFWNHMYNRQRDLLRAYGQLATQGGSTSDFARVLARSWWYFVVPQLVHALLKPSPQEQDDTLEGHVRHVADEVALGVVSGVPVLRDLANAAINGHDYTVTPIEQAGKAFVQLARDGYHWSIGEETSRKPIKNAAMAAGYAFGLPTGQASNTAQFLWDVMEGEQSPQSVADWWHGIQTGKVD